MRGSQNKYDAQAIHEFAHKRDIGREKSTQKVRQYGRVLHSYGPHFPIGFHLGDVFFITSSYWGGRCSRTDWHVWTMEQAVQHEGVKKIVKAPMVQWQGYPPSNEATSDKNSKKLFSDKVHDMYEFFANAWASKMKEAIGSMAKSIKPNTYESHRQAFLENLQEHDEFVKLFATHYKNKVKIKISKEIEILREALNKSTFRGVDTGSNAFADLLIKERKDAVKKQKQGVLERIKNLNDEVFNLHKELKEAFDFIKKLHVYPTRQENCLLLKEKNDFNIFQREIINKFIFVSESAKLYRKDIVKILGEDLVKTADRITFAFEERRHLSNHFIMPTLDEDMFVTTLGTRVFIDKVRAIVKMYNSTIPKDKMVGKHVEVEKGKIYEVESCDENHIKIGCHVFTRETIDVVDKYLVSIK